MEIGYFPLKYFLSFDSQNYFFTKHEMFTILAHLIPYIPRPSAYAILHSYF